MERRSPPDSGKQRARGDVPALHRAALAGDHAEIRRLIGAGEPVNSTFRTEWAPGACECEATPLMLAAGSGEGASEETVRLLLELGAEPGKVIEGRSAASFACEGLGGGAKAGGDVGRLRALLEAGCPLPKNPARANRLLCETAGTGDAARLGVLLERGLNARGHFDPEHAVRSHRAMNEVLARYEAQRPNPFASLPEEVRASIEEWARKQEEEDLERAARAPMDFEIPLFRAAESGSAECVELLLAAGADAMTRDNSHRTAMYVAGSGAVIRVLMAAGVPLEDADRHGWSPLDEAVTGGKRALVRVRALIEAGADVRATHDHGYTVLMSALGMGRHPEVLRLLVGAGADPHAVSEYGYNAFHAAIDVDGEANGEESVRDTLGYLRELGVDIEHRTRGGQTPLARAIDSGKGIEVRILCELGANPDSLCPGHRCGDEGCDAVEVPALFRSADGVGIERDVKTEALLRAGANPLVTDDEGCTVLGRVVLAICSDADDSPASVSAFFEGLRAVRLRRAKPGEGREEYVAAMSLPLRAYVERFASGIPVGSSSDPEYGLKRREESVTCIVLLCAYAAWWRQNPG